MPNSEYWKQLPSGSAFSHSTGAVGQRQPKSLPYSRACLLILMAATSERHFRSLTRCSASLLNLPTGAKMSQQLLWSTQMQTDTTHLFHVKQQTPIRSLQFSLVSIQGQTLISDLLIKSLYAVFGRATGNQSPPLYSNLKIIQLSTAELFCFCMFSSSNPFFFPVQRVSVPGVPSLQKCGFSSAVARNKFVFL